MKNKPDNLNINEYQSIRYLNLFRLLLSFFFFSIIFKNFSNIMGVSYTSDISKLIASLYLAFSILTWLFSDIYKHQSLTIGLIALVVDLPAIIALTLLFNGLNDGWVIFPVITIGSFSMLSRKPYTIIAMPIFATLLLWYMPQLLNLNDLENNPTSILLYSLTYFAIALIGFRQSQNYNQSVLLTQKQETRITNLSQINKLIIDQMQSGVVAFDNDYKTIMINNKAKRLLNLSQRQILPEFLIKKIVATQESSHKSVTIHGEEVLIHVINKDKASGLSLLFIEEQKQINEKSLQINLASLGQLSATIAHELRNPMAAIYSAAQLLNESESIPHDDMAFTDIIIKQVERSNEIIEDILLMSKPHVANQVNFNLNDTLIKLRKQLCEQHDLDFSHCEIDCDNGLSINFDNTHISQLFWNLAENALKHGEGNKLSINVSNQEKYVFIDFVNAGLPFEPIVEESLFTPFFTTHTQGTGLGLYICREMCRSNGAKLEYLRLDFHHVFRLHVAK